MYVGCFVILKGERFPRISKLRYGWIAAGQVELLLLLRRMFVYASKYAGTERSSSSWEWLSCFLLQLYWDCDGQRRSAVRRLVSSFPVRMHDFGQSISYGFKFKNKAKAEQMKQKCECEVWTLYDKITAEVMLHSEPDRLRMRVTFSTMNQFTSTTK